MLNCTLRIGNPITQQAPPTIDPLIREVAAEIVVTGQIDRVDRHLDGRRYAYDYKTGNDGSKTAEKAHRTVLKDGEIRWHDLQLPLYRQRLLEDGTGEVDVGYILLPQHLKKTRVDPLDWDLTDFDQANTCVDEILRRLSTLVTSPLTDAELEDQGAYDRDRFGVLWGTGFVWMLRTRSCMMDFQPQQPDPPTQKMIIANAGSGKTWSLSSEFARWCLGTLARTGRVDSDRILALTFTRKAAREILESIVERLVTARKNPDSAEFKARFPSQEHLDCVIKDLARNISRLQVTTIDGFVNRLVEPMAVMSVSQRVGALVNLEKLRKHVWKHSGECLSTPIRS